MIGQRIKHLRESFSDKKMTQSAFGEKIGVSRDVIANIEYGRVDPSQVIIKSICREFNVNEVWLRTGEGEMFNDISREEEIARFIGSLMKDSSESFKKSLILALSQLPETSWAVLEDFVNKIYDEYHNKDEP